MLKWVMPDELEAHVASKANEKFGTDVQKPRGKKKSDPKKVQPNVL